MRAPVLSTAINNLEKRLSNNPNDRSAIKRLVEILNFHSPDPDSPAPGRYSECHRQIVSSTGSISNLSDFLPNERIFENLDKWDSLLLKHDVGLPFPVAQVFFGNSHQINGEVAHCPLHLEMFSKNGAISRMCHDCFKVQILPTTLVDLFRLYFVLRELELPRDNARKCMVELREDVPYPYKGYIYCQSDDEARMCRDALQEILDQHRVTEIIIGLSHGCSEYGLKYPEFKYSADGAHNDFERPEWWDRAEMEFFATASLPKNTVPHYNRVGVTLRDALVFRTWLIYAEIVGDETVKCFRHDVTKFRPEPFVSRVRTQAKTRRDQLSELKGRLV